MPAALPDRTYEVIVFDWDGTAVPDRGADASQVRRRVEALLAAGVHVVVVSGTHVGNIDGQLQARPKGPGGLFLCLNRGSEVFEVGEDGPRVVWRREATQEEATALDRAAELAVSQLETFGITAKVVSQRLNRRKIDIVPEPEWDDPPKARIAELLEAVTTRLVSHGISDGLAGAVAVGVDAAREAGLADPKVTSDAKHVEIGLTDKADSMRWVLERMGGLGIGPGLMLVAGDEFGDLGNVIGSDAMMLVPEARRATAVSVGVEPQGVPTGVIHLGGGPDAFVAVLDEQLEHRRRMSVPAIDDDPRWVVEVTDDVAHRRVNESITTLANGLIGVRGAREEDGEGSLPLVLVNGVYTGQPVPRLLPGPIWPALMVRSGADSADRWRLDLRTGVLLRERDDGAARLRTFRFVSLDEPTVMGARAEGAASRLAGGEALRAPTPDIALDHHREQTTEIAVTRSDRNGGVGVATTTREVLSDGRRLIERLAAVCADNERLPDTYEARRRLEHATAKGFDALLRSHRAAWAERWRHASLSIVGDPDAELAVRFALFHLMASTADTGEAAVGARGLSGPAYAGHVFWDSDVFVLPVLAAVHPAAARAMLQYRVRRLPAAVRAAAAAGLPGARFPWESADDGTDVTPAFVRGRDGSVIPIRTGQREEHINADIAWAACEYAAWTGDRAFLEAEGRDLVLETARYWAGRIRLDRAGAGHLYGVIGPDEYHEVVDDNAYTNVMARWHLRRAALAGAAGGATQDEIVRWRALADVLVDGYRADTGVYEQFAGYTDLDPLLIADYATPPVAADMLLGPETVQRSQLIKQADVLMLYHLVPDETVPGSLLPNLERYGPRTAHGSSLSPPMHAAVLARAGRVDEALDLFRLACRLDLDDLTDTTAGGLHLATMGGVWQALAYGFLGVRPGEALSLDPRLPSRWERVELNLWFQGAAVTVDVGHDEAVVTTDQPIPLLVGPRRRAVDLAAGSTTIPLRKES